MQNNNDVCIIGLGYVGLTLALTMANKGFKVTGIENNISILKNLHQKKSHFYEPNINKILRKCIKNKNFTFFKKIPKKNYYSTFIITVGTPLNAFGKSRIDLIKKVVLSISKKLKDDNLIILRSTVKIGTTRKLVHKILKKSKKNFSLAYCPERTAEGRALYEITRLPQIISGFDEESKKKAKIIFRRITNKIITTSTLEAAEMMKIIDNTYRDMTFAYANEVSVLCDKLNISATEVINLGKFQYPRTNIPLPGPVGGPCLAKDTYILNESFKNHNIKPEMAMLARKINENYFVGVVNFLKKKFIGRKNLKISILGLSFKGNPPTSDLRGSPSINLIKKIQEKFYKCRVNVYDNLVSNEDFKKNKIKKCVSLDDCFKRADIAIIANNNNLFKKINLNKMSKIMNNKGIIYDCWNLYNKNSLELTNRVNYYAFGNQSEKI
jgi:nucleotide sugar dehydrogenase